MTSLQKDVGDALRIDDVDKPAASTADDVHASASLLNAARRRRRSADPGNLRRGRRRMPQRRAAGDHQRSRQPVPTPQDAGRSERRESQGRQSVMSDEDIEASKAPLMDHLIELRSRLIKALLGFGVAFIFCFFFAKQIYNVLVWPFVWVAGPENSKFIYTALLEYFITQLKLALFGAGFISFPIVATQIYKFVAPGLYKHERGAFLPYLIATPFFFVLGSMLVYFVVLPMLVRFSLGMQQAGRRRDRADPASAEGRRISVADDVADLRLRHRVPVAGDPDAARAGSASSPRRQLREKRRYFIVVAFIIAAVLTPPDVLSQASLAIPLLALYEGSIIAVRIVEKKAAKARPQPRHQPAAPPPRRPIRRSRASARRSPAVIPPRKRGIQYAAASRARSRAALEYWIARLVPGDHGFVSEATTLRLSAR